MCLASSPGHTHLSMFNIERWVWPGDEARVCPCYCKNVCDNILGGRNVLQEKVLCLMSS